MLYTWSAWVSGDVTEKGQEGYMWHTEVRTSRGTSARGLNKTTHLENKRVWCVWVCVGVGLCVCCVCVVCVVLVLLLCCCVCVCCVLLLCCCVVVLCVWCVCVCVLCCCVLCVVCVRVCWVCCACVCVCACVRTSRVHVCLFMFGQKGQGTLVHAGATETPGQPTTMCLVHAKCLPANFGHLGKLSGTPTVHATLV